MDSMDRTLADGTGGNIPAGNVLEDPIRVLHLEVQALRRQQSDLRRTIASTRDDSQQAHILRSSESEYSRAEIDMEALEDLKNNLMGHVRHFELRIMNLLKEKVLEATNVLKKKDELRLVLKELNFEAEKTKVVLKEKEDAVDLIFKRLKKLLEKKKKIAGGKKSLISFEERQLLLREDDVRQQAIHRKILKLTMEMRKQWVEIGELLFDYKELMEKISWEDKNDRNDIPRYIVVFWRVIGVFAVFWRVIGVFAVAIIVAFFALRFFKPQ